jgi:hypothetical protein
MISVDVLVVSPLDDCARRRDVTERRSGEEYRERGVVRCTGPSVWRLRSRNRRRMGAVATTRTPFESWDLGSTPKAMSNRDY